MSEGPSLGDGEVAQEDRVQGEGRRVHPTEVGGKGEAPSGRTGLRRDGGRGLRAAGRDLQRCQAVSQPTQRAPLGRAARPHCLHLVGLRYPLASALMLAKAENMLAAATPVRVRAMHTVSLQLPAGRPGPAIGQGRLPSPGRRPVARGQEGGKAPQRCPGRRWRSELEDIQHGRPLHPGMRQACGLAAGPGLLPAASACNPTAGVGGRTHKSPWLLRTWLCNHCRSAGTCEPCRGRPGMAVAMVVVAS